VHHKFRRLKKKKGFVTVYIYSSDNIKAVTSNISHIERKHVNTTRYQNKAKYNYPKFKFLNPEPVVLGLISSSGFVILGL